MTTSVFRLATLAAVAISLGATGASAHEHASHARPKKEDAPAALPRTPAPADVELYIISPANGDAVTSPLRVQFGLRGMGVAPAGTNAPNTGHHHLLIDVEEMPSFAAPLPATDNIVHFGGGQTETTIELEPGIHSLQLVLGNFLHIPHDPPVMSKQIQIKVVEN
ncbi:MAG: DUF4399 domain-containing protein [Pseudomonadota bacterium]